MRGVFFFLSSFAALVVVATPARVHACGGFFCNNSQPVNQAAERIIFSQSPTGEVTAVIQIQYQGPSERFAWLLPVTGSPDIGVSSDAAFMRLQGATNPRYNLTTRVEGECYDPWTRDSFDNGPFAAGGADSGASDAGSDAGSVAVVDEGSVGPYDYVIIDVVDGTEDPAELALEWLTDNEFDVSDFGGEILGEYLERGMNLLAFRLSKGNSAGSIRPVRISFGQGAPSIPIRPTAVAANDDMGVMVWVLGRARAIPANYRHLELNDALINWLNPFSNYNDVVTQAANEAGGQGFVTEMAADASSFADTIWQSWEQETFNEIAARDWTGNKAGLIRDLRSFSNLDGVLDVFQRHIEVPEGVDPDSYWGCFGCGGGPFEEELTSLDIEAFLADFRAEVIEPMSDTAQLFEDAAKMTRLYTTMSPHEMTVDPLFDYNTDLPDFSNVHNAERVIECSSLVTRGEAPWRVEFENGDVVRGQGGTWPFSVGDDDMPANRRILRVGTEGTGAVVTDNGTSIASALSDHNATVPGPPVLVGGGGSDCSAGGSAGFGFAALVGLALVFVRRRR